MTWARARLWGVNLLILLAIQLVLQLVCRVLGLEDFTRGFICGGLGMAAWDFCRWTPRGAP